MNTILELDTSKLTMDHDTSFLTIKWYGTVQVGDYKNILIKAVQICDLYGIEKVIIDRLLLDKIGTECGIWMKGHFLTRIATPILPKISKVATLESKYSGGKAYIKSIVKSVSLAYPNLEFKSFEKEWEALAWFQKD